MMRKKFHEIDSIDKEILCKGKNVIKDFDDSQEVYVQPKRQESKLISIRLPVSMIKNLRIVAQIKGDIGYQQMLKTYIAEGLVRDNQIIYSGQQYIPPAILFTSSSLGENLSVNEEGVLYHITDQY